jgi:RIO kinase 1
MDIKNITDFFRKKGVITLQERTAFEFITAENTIVDREEMRSVIDELLKDNQEKPREAEVDERVFRQAYIPKNLFEVVDPERDVGIVQQGGKNDLIYAKFLDVQETKPAPIEQEDHEVESDEDSSESSESEISEDDSKPRGKRHEDKDVKKVSLLNNNLIL